VLLPLIVALKTVDIRDGDFLSRLDLPDDVNGDLVDSSIPCVLRIVFAGVVDPGRLEEYASLERAVA